MEPENNAPPLEKGPLKQGSFKVIVGDDAPLYLGRLNARLDQLSTLLAREDDNVALPFMQALIRSVELLGLKHQVQGEDKVDFDLTISAKDSGLPTERDLYSLRKNREEATQTLKSLPARKEVISRLRKAILHGIREEPYQNQLRRLNFFKELAGTDFTFAGYHFSAPQALEDEGERRKYNVTWFCIERGTKLPVFYRMCLDQDRSAAPLEKGRNARLETVIYQTVMGPLDIGAFARAVDNEIAEVHPKLVEKYTVGPFYDRLTENSGEMSELLKADDEGTALKFSISRVVSERVTQYGGAWYDYLLGRKTEREVFSRVFCKEGMIVPFRAVQNMKGKDEYRNPCKIYGVTKGGEIIG